MTFGFIMLINQRLQYDITTTKDHFQSIFSVSPGAVLLTSIDNGKIIDINATFTQITGFTKEETIGKTTAELGLWKNVAERENIVNDIINFGRCNNREISFTRKSGEEFIGLVSASVISLNDRPHIISITQDVTERYLAEEKIKASEEKYRTLAETTPNIIVMHDLNGVIIFINKAGLDLIQLPESEIIGKSIKQFVSDDLIAEMTDRQQIRQSGSTKTLEYKTALKAGGGKILKFRVISAPVIKNGKMESLLLVANDITEQEQTMIELTRAKRSCRGDE
ncbi:MAG: PAS domain-containing protein [Ignavibacteriales bacterium]|nr:PAS domain-containing protein [Ignavibacteriales bacterium]